MRGSFFKARLPDYHSFAILEALSVLICAYVCVVAGCGGGGA